MTKRTHTAREILDAVTAHFGESHANFRRRGEYGYPHGWLFLTPVKGCDYDEHDDIHIWHGDVEDSETGEVVGTWSAPDHWPEIDVVWA